MSRIFKFATVSAHKTFFPVFNENVRILNGSLAQKHFIQKGPNAKRVLFDNCDINFVYYSLHRKCFPKIEEVYFKNHPHIVRNLLETMGSNIKQKHHIKYYVEDHNKLHDFNIFVKSKKEIDDMWDISNEEDIIHPKLFY